MRYLKKSTCVLDAEDGHFGWFKEPRFGINIERRHSNANKDESMLMHDPCL